VGDSRGTLFRVRLGFARGVTSPAALPVLLLAAALFLRGFAIILRVRRERERDDRGLQRRRRRRRRERWVANYGGLWRWPF
jgi:hypothetical protein